jgi:hypothetical protein
MCPTKLTAQIKKLGTKIDKDATAAKVGRHTHSYWTCVALVAADTVMC